MIMTKDLKIEDIFPKEYLIPNETSEKLAKLAVYVFDDRNKMVVSLGGWDYYNINHNGHRVPILGKHRWFEFSSSEAAEKFVTNQLKRDLEEFSFSYVDQTAAAKIMEESKK